MEKKRVDESVPVSTPLKVDRFGFLTQELNSPEHSDFELRRAEKRVRKWRKMIGIGGHYVKKNPNVVKWQIRKGIPDCLTGLVWQLISGSRDLLLMNPGVYDQLVIYETSASELDIICDISRTFPSHIYFQQRHGPGQRSLYNILKAHSVYDTDVGYVQAGLPLVQQYLLQFDGLMKDYLPKLGKHITQEMINPSMYASQWFITVSCYSFPFHLARRMWDVFLHEGVKIIFKVGVALLKYCHDDLVKLPFEKLIYALRNFPDDAVSPDKLLPIAYSIKVSKSLAQVKHDYERKNEGKQKYSYLEHVDSRTFCFVNTQNPVLFLSS